ncbi:MAG: cytidine deaminase [bacterium]|nr:cytidine deaminase [bacterium]
METISFEKLTEEERNLVETARKAREYAYNPETGRLHGAAVLTFSGKVFPGSNFYSSASQLNVCAERAAALSANSSGSRDIKIVAVVGDKKNPLAPCGICRQFFFGLTEITGRDIAVICVNKDKSKIIKTSILELFPFPYSDNSNHRG